MIKDSRMIRMHCQAGKAASIETYSQFVFMAPIPNEHTTKMIVWKNYWNVK